MANYLKVLLSLDGAEAAIRRAKEFGASLDNISRNSNLSPKINSSGIGQASAAFKGLGNSMRLSRQEALTLNYTINDVVASLASGSSPMTILLQQGPQVQQVFGNLSNFIAKVIPGLIRFAPALAAAGTAAAAFKGISVGEQAGKDLNELRIKADQAGVSIKTLEMVLAQGAGENVNMDKIAAGFERMKDAALAARQVQDDLNTSREKAIKDAGPLNSTAADFAKKIDDINEKFKGKDIFSKLNISLAGYTGSAQDIERLSQRVVASLNSIGDAYRRNELEREAEQALGEDFVRVLKNGSRETTAFQKILNGFLNSFDPDKAAQVAKSQQTAADQLAQLRKKVSDAEGAIFIPAAQAKDTFLTQFLLKNETAVRGYLTFLQSISTQIQDFFLILQGDSAAKGRNPITTQIIDGFIEIERVAGVAKKQVGEVLDTLTGGASADAVANGVALTLKNAFLALYETFDKVTKAFNQFFGTDINTETALAVAAMSRMIPVLGIVNGLLLAMKLNSPFGALMLGISGIIAYSAWFKKEFAEIEGLGLSVQKLWLNIKKLAAGMYGDQYNADIEANKKAIEENAERQKALQKESDKYAFMSTGDALKARLKDGFNAVNEFLGEIGGAGDETKSAFDKVNDTLAKTQSHLKSASDEVQNFGVKSVQSAEQVGAAVAAGGMHPERINDKFAKFVSPTQDQGQPAGAFSGREKASFARSVSAPGAATPPVGESAIAQPYRDMTKAAQEAVNAGNEAKRVSDAAMTAVTIRSPKNLQDGVTGGVYKDKPGNEGIDNTLYKNMKVDLDQIETGATKAAQKTAETAQNTEKASSSASIMSSFFEKIKTPDFSSVVTQLATASQYAEKIASSLQSAGSSFGGSGMFQANDKGYSTTAPTRGYATGGHVRGPGTSTSDSILAWLSNGEFVMNAAAVSAIGVGPLNALNAGYAPAAIAAPGFADGGFVGGYSPPGGMAAVSGSLQGSGGGNVTIVLDNKPHGPFSGAGADIDALGRAAAAKRAARTAKTPSRVG